MKTQTPSEHTLWVREDAARRGIDLTNRYRFNWMCNFEQWLNRTLDNAVHFLNRIGDHLDGPLD